MLKSPKVLSEAVLVTVTYSVNSLVYFKSRSLLAYGPPAHRIREAPTHNLASTPATVWN